jgi:alpha-D-xyloside xylohydrolase
MTGYVGVTGKPTPFPYWTTGFWQSKNRYRSTAEVLGIAKEYQRLGIPLSMIVIDEGAWDLLGNEGWGGCANGSVTAHGKPCPCFADAAAMSKELAAMGVEVMLSPYMQFAVESSTAYPTGKAGGMFAVGVQGAVDAGEPACLGYSGYNQKNADDFRCLNATGDREHNMYCGDGCMWDVYTPQAGAVMMKNLAKTFYKESGIKWWWLDCDEPCDYTGRVSAGDRMLWGGGRWPDIAVGAQYPAALNRVRCSFLEQGFCIRGVLLSFTPHIAGDEAL